MTRLSQPPQGPLRDEVARVSTATRGDSEIGQPKRSRRGFGWVRKLPSGRYQASYLDPTGTRIPAKAVENGKTVPHKSTAEAIRAALERRGIVFLDGERPTCYFDETKAEIHT